MTALYSPRIWNGSSADDEEKMKQIKLKNNNNIIFMQVELVQQMLSSIKDLSKLYHIMRMLLRGREMNKKRKKENIFIRSTCKELSGVMLSIIRGDEGIVPSNPYFHCLRQNVRVSQSCCKHWAQLKHLYILIS